MRAALALGERLAGGWFNLTFNFDKYRRFKRAYIRANIRGDNEFLFDLEIFLVSYAKYLIEYLEKQFGIEK